MDPVARVVVDVPLAHLDRPFDYLVPAELADSARARLPGAGAVRRPAASTRSCWSGSRASEHGGRLAYWTRSVSAEPVLTPEVARAGPGGRRPVGRLAADVLRLAVPPRHARVEKRAAPAGRRRRRPPASGRRRLGARTGPARRSSGRWPAGGRRGRSGRRCRATTGRARLRGGGGRGAVGGRGALLVVPDRARPRPARRRAGRACSARAGTSRWPPTSGRPSGTGAGCAVRRGGGARSWPAPGRPAFAPVARPRAWSRSGTTATTCTPSPGRRTRTPATCCCCGPTWTAPPRCSAGTRRTAEAQQLVATGWAQPIAADRAAVRAAAPRVVAAGDDAELARDAGRPRPPGCPRWPGGPPGRRSRRRAGAGAGAAAGVPARAGLRAAAARRPGARTAPARWRRPRGSRAGLPVVRPPGRVLVLPGLRVGPAARRRRRRRAYGRGAGPGVPRGAGADLRRRGRAHRGDRRAGAGGGHPGRRAGGRGRLRRGAAARRLGAAEPAGPAGGRGGAAPVGERGRAGPPGRRRRAGGGRRRRRRWPRCRRWCAGTRPASPSGSWPSGPSWGFRRPRRFASLTGAPAAVADLLAAARLPASAEPLGPVPAGDGAERLLLRVPRADGGRAGRRAARRRRGPVRPQGPRPGPHPARPARAVDLYRAPVTAQQGAVGVRLALPAGRVREIRGRAQWCPELPEGAVAGSVRTCSNVT